MKGMINTHNAYWTYYCPCFMSAPMNNPDDFYGAYRGNPCPCFFGIPKHFPGHLNAPAIHLKDYGPKPFAVNIEAAARQNSNFRTALWTGNHLQLTLMKINVGEDIGLEIHPNTDQFLRIEEGQGIVKMGDSKERLDFQRKVYEGFAIFVPAGKWHNLINTGNKPIKLYSIYAPPQHPHGTVHETKEAAEAAEKDH